MEALAAALVRGEAVNWPADAAHAEQARFLEMAAFHGVRSLLAYQLHRMDLWPRWPAAITARLTETARVDAALEVVYRLELERVVAAMGSAGVRPLLLKGVALAYRHYPEPSLRPRYDTDLLVHRTDLAAVGRAMHALGYRRSTLIPGDLVMPQVHFQKTDRLGACHAYDVHWKIANPQPFADLLPIDELRSRSVDVPALGSWARAPGDVDALLLACIHRVAHHHDSTRLLWVYDIHLIASGLDRQAFARFTDLAGASALTAICARGLRLARERFHTAVPDEAMAALTARTTSEPSAVFLRHGRRKVEILLSDLRLWSGAGRPDGRCCASISSLPPVTCSSGTTCRIVSCFRRCMRAGFSSGRGTGVGDPTNGSSARRVTRRRPDRPFPCRLPISRPGHRRARRFPHAAAPPGRRPLPPRPGCG